MSNQSMFNEMWNAVLPGQAGVKGAGGLYLQALWANENGATAAREAVNAKNKAEEARAQADSARWNAERAYWLLRPGAAGVNAAGAVWLKLDEILNAVKAVEAKLEATHPGTTTPPATTP